MVEFLAQPRHVALGLHDTWRQLLQALLDAAQAFLRVSGSRGSGLGFGLDTLMPPDGCGRRVVRVLMRAGRGGAVRFGAAQGGVRGAQRLVGGPRGVFQLWLSTPSFGQRPFRLGQPLTDVPSRRVLRAQPHRPVDVDSVAVQRHDLVVGKVGLVLARPQRGAQALGHHHSAQQPLHQVGVGADGLHHVAQCPAQTRRRRRDRVALVRPSPEPGRRPPAQPAQLQAPCGLA